MALRYTALVAIVAVAVWAVIATGMVNAGYVRSGRPAAAGPVTPSAAGSVPATGTPPRQLIVPDLIAVVPAGISAAQVTGPP